VDGDLAAGPAALAAVEGADGVERRDGALLVRTGDGPAVVSGVTLALHPAGLAVRSLTLR